jgi:LemA protein
MPELLLAGFVLLVPLVYVAATYNGLTVLRNHIREAWANIDTELKRRYELIPNLVATVKGYAQHEQTVLQRVVELRNLCLANSGSVASQAADERQLVGALGQLLAVVERYPELQAADQFLRLQEQLTITEDRIQAARRFYNGNIRDYRNKCEMFPSSLIAALFRFPPVDYFEVEAAVREAPQATF